MRETGMELMADVDDLAVMGFSDIPRLIPKLAQLKRKILDRIRRQATSLVILVDYPGFNLNLAQAIKKLPYPPSILYYIAPQVWAWRASRTKAMKKAIDQLAVVFPFEEKLFSAIGMSAKFVGHPLLDELETYLGQVKTSVNASPKLLALLPGSRLQEIRRLLPLMITAAETLRHKHPELSAAVGMAPQIDIQVYMNYLTERNWIEIRRDSRRLMFDADVAAVCSGTATLETALLGTPLVVVYKTSLLNYLIARRFVRLERISLVNVVAGHEVVRELIQNHLTAPMLSAELERLWKDDHARKKIQNGYETIRIKLGTPGAAQRVAEMAHEMISSASK